MSSSDLIQYFFNIVNIKNDYASNDEAVCLSQTLDLGDGSLVLDGGAVVAGVAVLKSAVKLKIVGTGDLSSTTFTIIGTDVDGNPLEEVIVGPDGSPDNVVTTNYFKTVTEIQAVGGSEVPIAGTVGVANTGGVVKVFDGAGRIRSIYASPEGSGSDPVIFYKNVVGGINGFAYVPKDNVGGNILFPDMGVRFPDSCYMLFPSGNAFKSLSVMVS